LCPKRRNESSGPIEGELVAAMAASAGRSLGRRRGTSAIESFLKSRCSYGSRRQTNLASRICCWEAEAILETTAGVAVLSCREMCDCIQIIATTILSQPSAKMHKYKGSIRLHSTPFRA
jgi:hypothetical protein